MPIYTCVTTEMTLSDHVKATMAAEITKIHSSITAAPTSFVHVVFQELPATNMFIDSSPSQPLLINGVIRAGRTAEQKTRLPWTSPRAPAASPAFRRRASMCRSWKSLRGSLSRVVGCCPSPAPKTPGSRPQRVEPLDPRRPSLDLPIARPWRSAGHYTVRKIR